MNKTEVVLHCRNTSLLNRFTVHSSRRTVIRIHEDSAFKRKQQVVFPSDKIVFVWRKPRPSGKGGNICSQVAISKEKKYKSQNQTDGEDKCDKNGQEIPIWIKWGTDNDCSSCTNIAMSTIHMCISSASALMMTEGKSRLLMNTSIRKAICRKLEQEFELRSRTDTERQNQKAELKNWYF